MNDAKRQNAARPAKPGTRKRKPEPAVIDSVTQSMRCNHCGSVAPIPLGDIDYCCKVMLLFSRVHRKCKPGDKPRTWQSVPNEPVTTDESR